MPGNSAASSRPLSLRLSLGCELEEVRIAVQTIRGFLAEQGWTENDLMSFDLALVEACNNAIKYADDAGRAKPIELEAITDSAGVEFRIHDHTPGFEWPAKIELPDPLSESGRGLYLITSLMDYAAYFRGRAGNILILRKSRAGHVPADSPADTLAGYARKLAENERLITDMVEELSSCYESLSAIFRYTAEQAKSGNLQDFAQQLFRDLLQIIGADWFILRLVPKGESRLVVFAASEPALELEPLPLRVANQPPQYMEVEAAITRKPVWFDANHPMPPAGMLIKAKPGAVGLVHPILLGDQLIGTVTLGKASPPLQDQNDPVFTAAHTNVVNTFADFLAIQIASARYQEEQFSRRLVTHELEIANNIQRSLLLTSLPQLPGFNLAAFCRSAHEVGGDFYDVLKINEYSLLLVIADVMGKGIPAAMFAAILRTLLRAAPELTHQPAALLTRVNRLLFPELSGVDMFITAQLAFVDSRARRMVAASAGHCPLAIARAGQVKTFAPEGMPLGILEDSLFQEEAVELPENCRVLLYTDGLPDALNSRREHFGQQRLMDWLGRTPGTHQSAEELKDELAGKLAQHQINTTLNDDQTFLIMSG